MKNWMTTAAVLALSASLAVAAPHGRGGEKGRFGGEKGDFAQKFAEKLGLTDAQKQQVEAIRKASREKNAAFFEQFRATREQFQAAHQANDGAKIDALKAQFEAQREQMKQIRDAERQQVLSILTADQKAKLEAMKAERGERGERGQRGMRGMHRHGGAMMQQ